MIPPEPQKFELWEHVRPTIPVISESKDPIGMILEVRVQNSAFYYLICFDSKSWQAIFYHEGLLEPLTPMEQLSRV